MRDAILQRQLAGDRFPSGKQTPTIDQVVLTAGSNQLLHLVADALLDPGDIVLTSAPSYFVYLSSLNGIGARTVGVAMDERQNAYAEQHALTAMVGGHAPPPCPMCGHHTVSVKLHGHRAVG